MRVISTDRAPAAVGPYSQAVGRGELVLTSGQIGLDPFSGELASGFDAQVARALENLDAVLAAAGSRRDRVLKVTVYVTDMGRFVSLNEAYAEFFGSHRPARSVVGVAALPKGAEVEIEAVAVVA
jgi:2-iminobutanoate/2-iminopropanoate deaminase